MVAFIFMIGVLNVTLGYAVAVWLGYGPPGVWEAWDALLFDPPAPTGAPQPAETAAPPAAAVDFRSLAAEEMLDDGEDDLSDLVPLDESYDDDVADLLRAMGPDSPEHWNLSEKYVETSILRLNIAMMRSGIRSTEIDTRLRACAGTADETTVEECLRLLREDCESYLAEQSEAAEKFRARIGELGELSELGEEIEIANLEQAAQIETTLSNLKHMDFRSDIEAARGRLLVELAKLREARHRLRDSQEAAFLTIARYEGRLEAIEKQLYNDPLTGLRNRIGLETTLWQWWNQGRQRSRQMTAVALDIDDFGRLNEQFGPLVCDRIVYALGRFLQEKASEADLVSRLAGQRFLVMMVDVGPRTAVKNAEQLRQTIEKIGFRTGGEEITLSVSLGITEVKPDDAHQQILDRVEAALRESKRGGRNRSTTHDGRHIEPVDAPNLGIQPLEIVLAP